jgi:hypothetical protein
MLSFRFAGHPPFLHRKRSALEFIEHLLLDIVARAPSSTTGLSEKSGLPRRVIVEAFTRFYCRPNMMIRAI